MKRFKSIEIIILFLSVFCIFLSEYLYVFENNPQKAIFIGLWPPTMIGLLIFFNNKKT